MMLAAIVGFSIALLCYPLSYQQPIELVTGLLLLFHNVATVAFWIIGGGGRRRHRFDGWGGGRLLVSGEDRNGCPRKSAKDDLGDHAV